MLSSYLDPHSNSESRGPSSNYVVEEGLNQISVANNADVPLSTLMLIVCLKISISLN